MTAHGLKADRHTSLDSHGAAYVDLRGNLYLEEFQFDTKKVGYQAHRGIQARGKSGAKNVSRRRSIVQAPDSAMNPDWKFSTAPGHGPHG